MLVVTCRFPTDDAVRPAGVRHESRRLAVARLPLPGGRLQPLRLPGPLAKDATRRGDAGEHHGQRKRAVHDEQPLRGRLPLVAASLPTRVDDSW